MTLVLVLLLLLAAFVLLLPMLLARNRPRFFETPYITWFLLHFGIGALAIIALAALAIDGVLGAPLVAIFSGLFGFIFGSTAARSATSEAAGKGLTMTGIMPKRAAAANPSQVVIYGRGIDAHATAALGEGPVSNVTVSSDGSVLVGTAPAHAAGDVDVIVSNPDGTAARLVKGFTYTP